MLPSFFVSVKNSSKNDFEIYYFLLLVLQNHEIKL
nr:MAG TPA: hypothetical protein [Caudoviricetes sp.]DAY35308.1 MAG TPA: hypothetical protein [Caudoviricetes sp.]